MRNATFAPADLTTFTGLNHLGLKVTSQRISEGLIELVCEVSEPDQYCHECGCWARVHDIVVRTLAHAPMGFIPVRLHVQVRRYACTGCGRVYRQDTTAAAARGHKLSRGGLAWGLHALICHQSSVARIAADLGVSWGTVNAALLIQGLTQLVNDATRFDGVEVIGVDEHVWRHTKTGEKYVTVIIDLTPVRNGTGPARLLDMIQGRSKAVFKSWLAGRDEAFRAGVQLVAMDGFAGFKTAAAEELPAAVAVMDPFHLVQLAGDGLDECRRRVQQEMTGRRGRKEDSLYKCRRLLHTGEDLLTEKQRTRLAALFAHQAHTAVEITWCVYQRMVAAYRNPDPAKGRTLMQELIASIQQGVPAGLDEVRRLGRTLAKRAADVLAYFDHPRTSNGPTEALNGRLEHLRGIALGFRNFSHYALRALLHAGGFRSHTHSHL